MISGRHGMAGSSQALKKAKAKVQLDKDLDRAPGPAKNAEKSGENSRMNIFMWLFEDVVLPCFTQHIGNAHPKVLAILFNQHRDIRT